MRLTVALQMPQLRQHLRDVSWLQRAIYNLGTESKLQEKGIMVVDANAYVQELDRRPTDSRPRFLRTRGPNFYSSLFTTKFDPSNMYKATDFFGLKPMIAHRYVHTAVLPHPKDGQQGRPKGPGQEDEDKKAADNQIRALKFTMYAMGGLFTSLGLYIFFVYGAPMTDQNGDEIRDAFSDLPFVVQYWKRASAEIRNYVKYIVNPSRDKLLPDPVKHPYHQPPYTLLIELTGVLVHPEWTYKTGWRFKKRPGIDYFLSQVAGYQFEVVIYTHEPGMLAFPIVDALDQQGLIHYRLFRDSTKYENGVHLKDLDKVNRDLTKVIVVDCNEKALQKHRSNAIILPKWNGNDDDRSLFDLAALLQTIGSSEVKDVRGVLEYYSDYPDPIAEFRRKQMALAQQEQETLKKAEIKVAGGFSPTGNFLGSLFRKS